MSKKSAGKTGLQTVFLLFDIRRRAVTGENDILFIIEKSIESIKNLCGRRTFFTAEKLDIVNQKIIEISVLFTETLIFAALDGFDQLIRKRFAGHEKNG